MRAVNGRVLLEPGDLERFELLAARFPRPAPWPPGRWLQEEPERLWLEFVTQLLVVGGRRPVDEMWRTGRINSLSLGTILEQAATGRAVAERYVHDVLAASGVRYAILSTAAPAAKAVYVVSAACSPSLVRDGVFRLREALLPLLPDPPEWSPAARQREQAARLALIRLVRGFGMKSASDFLNHIGASQNLLAFDSRIQTLLASSFGLGGEVRRLVSRPGTYEALERPFVEEVCPHLAMSPAVLDELLFANSEAARRLLTSSDGD